MKIACGVDIGARSIEVVLSDGAQVLEWGVADTGSRPTEAAEDLFARVLSQAEVRRADISCVTATGYGRNYFKQADKAVSEILCHARGVWFLFPRARSIIDIGGQDSKLIELDGNGRTVDFAMNDRCAAGTGRFIELTGQIVGIPVDRMGEAVEGRDESVEISSMCAVFAESEIVGLLQSGSPIPAILNGVFRAVARRTVTMSGRARLHSDVVFTGGVALNRGVVKAMEDEIGLPVLVPPEPQITGALGAALTGFAAG
jgi:(R)-2-hydroxyacyl-CoA dehydratese activating ATPase